MDRVRAAQMATEAAETLVDALDDRARYHFPDDDAYEAFVKRVERALTPILEGVPA